MGTLLRLRPLMKELKLDGLLKGDAKNTEILGAVLTTLTEANKINEFCQIISDTNDDFLGDVEVGTVMWLISDFFEGLRWSMPPIWRQKVKTAIEALIALGAQVVAQKTGQAVGGTILQTGPAEPGGASLDGIS